MQHRIELRARATSYFAYSGRSLLVTNLEGNITGHADEGFYHENTRLLSRDDLTADGQPLRPVVASAVDGHGILAYLEVPQERRGQQTPAEAQAEAARQAEADEEEVVPKRAVFVELARLVDDGMRTRLRLTSYNPHQPARFDLAIHLAADFADIIEAERGQRQQQADVDTTWDATGRELCFRYCHPELDRAVAIRVERGPDGLRFADGALIVPLELHPHQPVEIDLAIEPIFDGQRRQAPAGTFGEVTTRLGRVRQQLRDAIPRLTTTNPTVARAWQTATQDLATLPLGLDAGPATPIAGLPLYQQFFGRDTLTIAWQALMALPALLRDTLQANAAWQGTTINDWRDEEPGKLIHQARQGPTSALGLDPHARYYGDYATPVDFLIMLGQYLAWTNDRATVRQLLPAAHKALAWLDRYADLDGDGFIEYVTRSEMGVKNQGWKDSRVAIVDEHGALVANPIATSELQAYWYAGLRQAAFTVFATGDAGYALDLLGKARALKRRFDTAFWMHDEGFYALALGPDKRPVRTIASNAGHLLATGIVPVEKAGQVIRRLMAPDLFSGWGIRTLSAQHPSYNPFSYHLGSVWPVDAGTFALGFARYGYWSELHQLAEATFAATDLFVSNRLPEAIGGLPRDADHPHPGIYPRSNEPQGWSSSAIILIIQALLGMVPVAPLGLLLVDPHLPPWLPDLRLEGVQVGTARLDLQFWRTPDGRTQYRVTDRQGRVRVLRQPPPNAAQATLSGRLGTGLRSLWRA